jgi:hypothetical protein
MKKRRTFVRLCLAEWTGQDVHSVIEILNNTINGLGKQFFAILGNVVSPHCAPSEDRKDYATEAQKKPSGAPARLSVLFAMI